MRLQIVALAIAASAIIQAQPPGHPPRPDFTALKTYLNLTDAQVTSLGDLNKAQREATRPLSEDLRSKHQVMNTLLGSAASDPAAIAAAAQSIQAAEQKVQGIHQQYQAQAAAMLTVDQQANLKVLTNAAAALSDNVHQAAMLGLIAPPFRRGPGPSGQD